MEFKDLGDSALISADNGEGKTNILRSIAMGLCDESSAAGLLRELPGELVRKHAKEDGKIKIHLENKAGDHYEIETTIESLPAFERATQNLRKYENGKPTALEQKDFPWKDIFVCGYGAGRQTQGTADLEEYAAVDAVYTLFRYQEPLQNPELAIRRLVEKARTGAGKDPTKRETRAETMLELLRSTLKRVLNLDLKDRVIVTPTGIEVKGHWGRSKLGSLGDGYRATITWVMDFLSWRMLSRKSLDPKKMSGIVLIDEVEQHLHPRWQINIMQLLREVFPKIQFIATTHSPLTVSGCKDCKVHTIGRRQHKISNVYGWLAEDVYYEVMGLPTSRAIDVEGKIEEFKELHFKKIDGTIISEDVSRLKELETELRALSIRDTQIITNQLRNLSKYLKLARKESQK